MESVEEQRRKREELYRKAILDKENKVIEGILEAFEESCKDVELFFEIVLDGYASRLNKYGFNRGGDTHLHYKPLPIIFYHMSHEETPFKNINFPIYSCLIMNQNSTGSKIKIVASIEEHKESNIIAIAKHTVKVDFYGQGGIFEKYRNADVTICHEGLDGTKSISHFSNWDELERVLDGKPDSYSLFSPKH